MKLLKKIVPLWIFFTKMNELEYINLYKEFSENIKRYSPDIMNVRRDESLSKFTELGFPDKKSEIYKYADLVKPFSFNYGLNINRLTTKINAENIFRCNVGGINSFNYLIVNDDFIDNSAYVTLPQGVTAGSLRQIAKTNPELVENFYGKLADAKQDGLIAFNSAFAQDGFFIFVPDNTVIDKPLQLINLMSANVDLMANSRNLIILGKNSKLQLLVCEHTAGDVNYFANRVTEVFVGENAEYEHYTIENSNSKFSSFSTLLVEQAAKSRTLINSITLHNGTTHNNTDIYLNGEHAETLLCGLVTGDKNQSTSNSTAIYHNKPNCTSSEIFKYILDDNSLCGFAGKIFVEKNAQKTSALQTNKNLLLTKNARMRTKPQLEIYADDVKCSHGATVGQLDEQALFYMRQRGISFAEARLMLMFAFVADIIENVRIAPLRDRLKMMVENRLRTGNSQVGSCAICF